MFKKTPLDCPLDKVQKLKSPIFDKENGHLVQITGASDGMKNCVLFLLKEKQ